MRSPEVSIIMPNYNGSAFITEAIESVLQQTFSDWELIIIDDQSTDASMHFILHFVKAYPMIRLIQNESRMGPGAARNKGLELARGRFITFLDSDDLWPAYRLEIQLTFMKKKKICMCFGDYIKISLYKKRKSMPIVAEKDRVEYANMIGNPMFSIITIMIDTSKMDLLPRFPEEIWRAEDYSYHLNLLSKGFPAFRLPHVLAQYRVRQNSNSNRGCMKEIWWVLTVKLKFSPMEAIAYFMKYLWKAFGRRIAQIQWLPN